MDQLWASQLHNLALIPKGGKLQYIYTRASSLDEGRLTLPASVKCTNIHIGSHALIVYSVYQGYLTGSLHHEGSVGLDI